MKTVLFAIVFFNFASYFWSVIGVFKKIDDMDWLQYRVLQATSVITWVYSLYIVYMFNLETNLYLLLSIIQIFCGVSFWVHTGLVRRNSFSIAFSKDTPKTLIQSMFYSRVRHPFYMIYLLSYYSIAFAYLEVGTLSLALVMTLVYYRAARFEENKFLSSDLADEYSKYRARTWMLFPKLK